MLPVLENAKVLGLSLRAWIGITVGAILFFHLGLRMEMVIQYRTELGGVEHNVIHGVQKLLLGLALYQDPERLPFDVMQYAPAYYLLCAGIGDILGIEGNDARSVFVLSRTLALVLTMLTALVAYRICRIASAPVWASFLAAALVFCTYTEHFYSRPDALHSLGSLATVLFFVRWLRSPTDRPLILAALFAVLAFFAKQSGGLVMVLPVVYLVWSKEWHGLRVYGTAVAVLLGCALGITFLLVPPVVLWQNTVQGLANGFSWQMWQELFDPPTYKYFIGWHAMAVVIAVLGFRSASPVLRFFALAIPLAMAFGLLTGLKYGSRLNYLHEGLALVYIGAAVMLGNGPDRGRNQLAWAFALYGLIFMGFRTKSTAHWAGSDGPEGHGYARLQADTAVRNVLQNELDLQADDHVLILYRDYLEHLLVGQSILTQKDIIQYSKEPVFNYGAFHKAMEDGTVRYVITDQAPGPFTILGHTYDTWVPVRTVEGRHIMAKAEAVTDHP
jgi:hypothetical protein